MSEPNDNDKRAKRLAELNARKQEQLERRRITLQRRQEAEAIVQESNANNQHAISVYQIQLEMAIAKQKRVDETILKDIQKLKKKLSEKEDELEDKREAEHKKVDERFDKQLDDLRDDFEERINRLQERLEKNKDRQAVKNMEKMIEDMKNKKPHKKTTVADVVRTLEQEDIDQALEEIPTIRQNVIVQENSKQNKKLLEEAHCDQFLCKGCEEAGENSNHIFEKPAFNDGTWDYCSICVREGRVPIQNVVVRTAPVQVEKFQCSGCCVEDGGWILESPSYSNGDEKYCACCVEEEKHIK